MQRWTFAGIGLLLLVFVGVSAQQSQAQLDASCSAFVQRALDALADNCSGLGRNSACYGFNRVDAIFTSEMPLGFFSEPSDLAELRDLQTISTTPLRVSAEEWGIAVLNVQTDLPDALPGQAVKYLLFGDVELEDSAETRAIEPVVPVAVTSQIATPLYTRPTRAANISDTIPADNPISADRISDDRAWLRVVYKELVGWVEIDSVEADGNLDVLPAVSDVPYAPMQAVRLRTNLSGVACDAAPPSLLVVQGLQQMTITLNVNGAELTIGSTVALWTIGDPPSQMVLAVIDGGAYLEDGTFIPAGFIVDVGLDADGSITGDWSQPRPMTFDEWRLLEPLENVPDSVLNYPIDVPSELFSPTPVPTRAPAVLPPAPPTVVRVDCTGLRPTSPLDGLPFGAVTFFWDGLRGQPITGYRVRVFRDGALVYTLDQAPDATNVSGDLSAIPLGGGYSWDVQALVNGLAVCTASINMTMVRAWPKPPPPPPTVEATPTVEPLCDFDQICEDNESPECPDCFITEPSCDFDELCEEGEDPESCPDCFITEPSCDFDELCEEGEDPESCPDCFTTRPACDFDQICEDNESPECSDCLLARRLPISVS